MPVRRWRIFAFGSRGARCFVAMLHYSPRLCRISRMRPTRFRTNPAVGGSRLDAPALTLQPPCLLAVPEVRASPLGDGQVRPHVVARGEQGPDAAAGASLDEP